MAEYTTKEGVKTEEWAVGFVNATNGKFAPIGDKAAVENSTLSDEQNGGRRDWCARNYARRVSGPKNEAKGKLL